MPVYPGNVAGNPYTDMQPAPQVAAPRGEGLSVASICLGIIGLALCISGLYIGAHASFSAEDSVERALAPLGFVILYGIIYIPGAIMNVIGLVLGKTGRKRAQDPRQAKACMVGIWLNAAPMLVFLVAEILAVLWMMGTSL
ncbi:MAG: hypothetical protein ACLR2J_05670 [Actinomyces sp.]